MISATPAMLHGQEAIETQTASVPAPQELPQGQAERAAMFMLSPAAANRKQQRIGEHHRPTPLAPLGEAAPLAAPAPPAQTSVTSGEARALAIDLLVNHEFSDAESADLASTVCEPSVATRGNEVLYTANWFAAFSKDGGQTFRHIEPSTFFPAIPNRDFCCDQVAIYDRKNDTMFWFLQYSADATGNTIRIAVAKGDDIRNERWRFYDFTPQSVGNWNNEWFDFPDLALSGKYLYATSNVFSTTQNTWTRAVVLRLPLDQLSQYQALNFRFHSTQEVGSIRPAQGGGDIAYFGAHRSAQELQVLTWKEADNNLTKQNVGIQTWSRGVCTARGPDGNDWLGRADGRITGAFVSNNVLGFAWTASQDGTFPFPQVRVALLSADQKTVVAQPHLWNQNFAFAYPAAAPNANGEIGFAVHYGGGSIHPSHAVGTLTPPAGGGGSWSWTLGETAAGTNGPMDNKWGDYQAVRPHGEDAGSWVATGFTLKNGSTRGEIVPRYIRFRAVPSAGPAGVGEAAPLAGPTRLQFQRLQKEVENLRQEVEKLRGARVRQ